MVKTIFLLHRGDDGIRGTEICFIQTAKAFTAAGFRIVVFRNNSVMDPTLEGLQPKPAIFDLHFPELMIDGRNTSLPFMAFIRAFFRLHRRIKKFKPSLLYCSGGLPCQLAVPLARIHRIPTLCHFHHPAIKRAYHFWLIKFANGVVFPSEFTKKHSRHKAGIEGRVVHNGIDLQRFHTPPNRETPWRAKLGIAPETVVIGQVAQLIDKKRPEFLIRAIQRLSQNGLPVHLCLVGKGPLEASIRDQIKKLGLSTLVTVTGYVEDVLPYYQHVFDINALVSSEEGLGISILEGSACELPAVVSRCTGLSETIAEGETGISFDPDSLDDLCEKLIFLVKNAVKRALMGRAGRLLIARDFSNDSYDRGMVQAANELIAERNLPLNHC